MILPRATTDMARSITRGGAPPGRGQANAMGLVPMAGALPPQKGMALGALPKTSAISPFPASFSAWAPAWPKWWEAADRSHGDAGPMGQGREGLQG